MQDSINGILFIDKEIYFTTFDIIRRIKKNIKDRVKIGHAGTLDPIATGLVVVLLGKATRIADIFHCFPKTYRAVFEFGIKSNTDDITGEVMEQCPRNIDITRGEMLDILKGFKGIYLTKPPVFSAKKIKGRPAYEYARKNIDIEMKDTQSIIYDSRLINVRGRQVELEFTVSKGTYIRSIARDMGDKTGYGCVMKELRRTSIGNFSVDDALLQGDISESAVASQILGINEVLYPYCTNHIDYKTLTGKLSFPEEQCCALPPLSWGQDSSFFIVGDRKSTVLMVIRKDRDDTCRVLYKDDNRLAAV